MAVCDSKDTLTRQYRDFQCRFHESVASGRRVENLCYDMLMELNENIKNSENLKRKRVNSFVESMIECIDNHLRYKLRKSFEEIGNSIDFPKDILNDFDSKSALYENCFRMAVENLERYNRTDPLKMIEKKTIESAKLEYAQFKTLVWTYRNLLEIDLTDKSAHHSDKSEGCPV